MLHNWFDFIGRKKTDSNIQRWTTIQANINWDKEDLMLNNRFMQSFGSLTPTDNITFGTLNNRFKLYKDNINKSSRKAHIIKYK